MHADIGVGMAEQTLGMGHLDAAQPDMIAGAKGVDVKAVADTYLHLAILQNGFRPRKIGGEGEFQVALLATDNGDHDPGSAGNLDVIRRLARVGAMGGKDGVKVKALRRLGAVQVVAVLQSGDNAAGTGPQGIGDEQTRGGRSVMVKRRHHRFDQIARHLRTGTVMDQNAGYAAPGQRLQPGAHRLFPRRPADHRFHPQPFGPRPVVWMDHQQPGHAGKGIQRMGHDGPAGQHLPLLGHLTAGAHAAAGGNNDGGSGHGSSLARSLGPLHRPKAAI